ncbi:SRPBCC domain-containing protein [Streptomyces yaizuensis]|uniref:SRPBCC domain-containing protein n=1 Tax=Streptomyces yaizuensis TaxID=2989713 RepID=A0ABQ5NZ48_9ACTN|nr:SRPBCC domain-containing protein [Streptomyces sp. YSPA8]GLF95639.1 SRPBCC domain-containing protein [Streptomyces sp. YSPA8]
MRRISSTVHIDASPHEVWAHLTAFDRFHEWNPLLIRAGGSAEAGALLRLRLRAPGSGRETSFRARVLRSEPGRLLRWRGRFVLPGLFDGVHSFELHPVEEGDGGGTRVLQYETLTGLLVPFTGTMHEALPAGFAALTDALKARVESARTPG